MTKARELAREPAQEDAATAANITPTKQAKITRFLPARKARENSKQSTPVGKRTRGGLVSVGEPDLASHPITPVKLPVNSGAESDGGKSPELKRNRAALVDSPPQQKTSVLVSPKTARTANQRDTKQAETSDDQKETVKAVPAYQRYAHLLDAADHDAIDRLQRPHLPLPAKYQLLVRLQQALDSTIAIQSGRGQRPVWHRLLPALQATLNRTVRPEHILLLQHFLPGVYVTEKCKIVEKGRRVDSFYVDLAAGQDVVDRQRKDALMASLLRHVEAEHERFLESINVVLPKNVELRNWHPKFDLEAVVDPVVTAITDTDKKIEEGKIPDIIKQAIEAVRTSNQNTATDQNTGQIKTDEPAKKDNEDVRDVKKPLSLKERIRLKEQQADLEKMAGPSSAKSKLLYASLPELIERISFLFSSSKKSVLFLSQVHERLKQSMSNPWSEAELDERLDVLAKHLSDWITVNRGDAPFTVKVDRSIALGLLKERILNAAPK